jgi:pimeloyl-ACP methyl ester carboxylesterase
MEQSIRGLLAERYPPEKPKFKPPLLLVHGLWSGPRCWQSWATHFCNLGWDCIALDLRRRSQRNQAGSLAKISFDDCVQDLEAVIRSFSTPPVLIAMNLGALMALTASRTSKLSALILVSPSPPANLPASERSRAQRILWLKYRFLIFLRRPIQIDEKDFRAYFLTPLPEHLQTAVVNQIAPEASLLVREFLMPRVESASDPLNCPLLVLAGSDDRLTPVRTGNRIAQWFGGEFREYHGQGHWLIEQDGESIVRDIHRWTIHKQGEQILLADFR